MILYRGVLSPQGPFRSTLHSDTFFGAFCWSYLRRHGRDALEQLLRQCREEGPRLIFSNAFPAGYLPLPLGVYDPGNDFERLSHKGERRAAYRRGKALKSARYVRTEAFFSIQAGNWSGFTSQLGGENTVSASQMHNMVLRDQQTADEDSDGLIGGLFSAQLRFPDPRLSQAERGFDLYVLTDLPKDEVAATLALAAQLGIGGDKSSGCGVFTLDSLEQADPRLSHCPGADGFVALSNFIPAAGDPTQGRYHVLAKYAALDRELAGEAPFKRPLLFLRCGSVFSDPAPRAWYGRCLTGVAAAEAPVMTNACTIAVPMTHTSG